MAKKEATLAEPTNFTQQIATTLWYKGECYHHLAKLSPSFETNDSNVDSTKNNTITGQSLYEMRISYLDLGTKRFL